jgi:hypothetical protein
VQGVARENIPKQRGTEDFIDLTYGDAIAGKF